MNVLHTWIMKRIIGSLGLYFDGLAPSMTPPCGGALFDGVGVALIVRLVVVDMLLHRANVWAPLCSGSASSVSIESICL